LNQFKIKCSKIPAHPIGLTEWKNLLQSIEVFFGTELISNSARNLHHLTEVGQSKNNFIEVAAF